MHVGYTHSFCAGTLPPAPCMPQRPGGPCICVCRLSHSLGDVSGILKCCMEVLKATPPAPLANCCMLTSSSAYLKAAAPSRSGALGVLLLVSCVTCRGEIAK